VDHAAARFDLALRTHDARFPLGDTAGEARAQESARAARGLVRRAPGDRHVEVHELGSRNREPHLRAVDGVDAGERGAACDELSLVDLLRAHAPGEGGANPRAIEIATRLFTHRARLAQPRSRHSSGVLGFLEPSGTGDLALRERLAPRQRRVGEAQLTPSPEHGRLGALERELDISAVELDEHITGLEERARRQRGRDPGDAGGDLGYQVDLGAGLDRAVGANANALALPPGLDDGDHGRGRSGCGAGGLRAALGEPPRTEGAEREDR
jgi:hypothetical protein